MFHIASRDQQIPPETNRLLLRTNSMRLNLVIKQQIKQLYNWILAKLLLCDIVGRIILWTIILSICFDTSKITNSLVYCYHLCITDGTVFTGNEIECLQHHRYYYYCYYYYNIGQRHSWERALYIQRFMHWIKWLEDDSAFWDIMIGVKHPDWY